MTSKSLFIVLFGLLLSGLNCFAASGAKFGDSSRFYEFSDPALRSDDFTFEALLSIDPNCPAGARVFDMWGTSSVEGCRLEVGAGGTLRFITTAPEASVAKAPFGTAIHVVAVFNPRQTRAELYVDGELAGSVSAQGKWAAPRTTIPLRIGADQDGQNRFVGTVRSVAVYGRALTPGEAKSRSKEQSEVPGLIGRWDLTADAGETIKAVQGTGVLNSPLKMEPASSAPSSPLVLWYRQPAREWVEALPVGNGRLGAMVFGGVEKERLIKRGHDLGGWTLQSG